MNAGTLKDVANRLNLSVSTVSRVVNGKGYVKEETRQRVLACLEACNYVPNEVARSLQARETMTIGVVVPDLCETYFGRIIKEIDRVVADAGYMLMVTDTGESRQQERRYLDSLYQKRVDALVLSSVDVDDPNVGRYYTSGTPVIFLDNLPRIRGEDVHYVMVDNHQASALAVQTLIQREHRQIALIVGSQEEPTGYERREGFCRAMEENGLKVDEELIEVGNFKKDGGYRCMQKLLRKRTEHPFTAVYVTSEMMTIGALQAIREANLTVGEDIAVIGFDVHDDLGLANPTIACVCQPEAEVGRSIGKMLLQLLKPEVYGKAEDTKVWLQAKLQLGSSLIACGEKAPADAPAADAPAADAPAADAPAADDGKLRVFMSAAYYTAPYGAPLMKAVQDQGEEMGYEVTIVDGEVNADKQLTQFKTAVADGYDALIYWPGDSASTPPVVEYLNSTGLPWVVVNTVPLEELYDQCTIVASDEVQIGRELGKLVVKYYEEKGEPVNIAYIEGDSGSSYTIHLTQGINEVIADYPEIKILNEPMYCGFDPAQAMVVMEDLITRFGNDIDLVLTQDGGMFQGAYNAIQAAGKLGEYGIICQGQDLIVKEKLLSGELYASVAQDPFQEGSLAIINLDKLIKGEPVDAWTYTPTGPIFAADVDNYSWF